MINFKNEINSYYSNLIKTINDLDIDELNKTMNVILNHYNKGSNIYVFGNGGSASTASHMQGDFNKGACLHIEKKFRFICLNDNIPTLMAISNDLSFDDVFWYQLQNKLKKDDLVIAISGSGNSKNIIKAVEYAKKIGSDIIGMTGYDGGKLFNLSNYHLHAPIDNMQITEDIHVTFNHMMMFIFWHYLEKLSD